MWEIKISCWHSYDNEVKAFYNSLIDNPVVDSLECRKISEDNIERNDSAATKPEADAQPSGEHNKSSLTCLCEWEEDVKRRSSIKKYNHSCNIYEHRMKA